MKQSERISFTQIEDDCNFISNLTEESNAHYSTKYQMPLNKQYQFTGFVQSRSLHQSSCQINPIEPPESPKELKLIKSEQEIRRVEKKRDSIRLRQFQPVGRVQMVFQQEQRRVIRPKSALKIKSAPFFRILKTVRFRLDNY